MTTLITSPSRPAGRRLNPAPVAWTTVGILAALMAYADGFVLTSVEGAIGTAARAAEPFTTWLRHSTLMLPVFVLAVLVALAVARRRLGPALRRPRAVIAALLLVAAAGSVVGTVGLVATVGYNFHLQSGQLAATQSIHAHAAGASVTDPTACNRSCEDQRQLQRTADVRAAGIGTAAILGANVVLVGWFVAFRGGEVASDRSRRAAHARN